MPKPGYYYYENKRALRGIAFVSLFAIGVYLAKRGPLSDEEFLDLYVMYRVHVLCCLLALCVGLFFWQRIKRWINEPVPAQYSSRSEFVAALHRYCGRMKYKPGWVFYRSNELWPDR